MNCTEALAALKNGFPEAEDLDLEEHLRSCVVCRGIFEQLERTWAALSLYPSIDPSPDSLPRLLRNLQSAESRRDNAWIWRPMLGWQWMAIAASLLILCSLFLVKSPQRPASLEPAITADQMDEKLLRDLEQTLTRTDAVRNYLPVYDQWGEAQPGNSPQTPPDDRVIQRKKIS